jgi:hypothetical protein
MTNDELKRTMEFIVEQQAQFAANIQRFQYDQLRDRPRLARLEDSFQILVKLAEASDARMDSTDTRDDVIEENVVKHEANMVRHEANMAEHERKALALPTKWTCSNAVPASFRDCAVVSFAFEHLSLARLTLSRVRP